VGRTALMAACELGWLEIVQFLVSFEADINMKNDVKILNNYYLNNTLLGRKNSIDVCC
jgi:hypothetical protein